MESLGGPFGTLWVSPCKMLARIIWVGLWSWLSITTTIEETDVDQRNGGIICFMCETILQVSPLAIIQEKIDITL